MNRIENATSGQVAVNRSPKKAQQPNDSVGLQARTVLQDKKIAVAEALLRSPDARIHELDDFLNIANEDPDLFLCNAKLFMNDRSYPLC